MKAAEIWQAARGGFDVAVGLFAALSWSFAAFVIGARFVSPTAGGLVAVAVFSSGVIAELKTQLSERRLAALLRGNCPQCGASVTAEHRHRRWEPLRSEWLSPDTAWGCRACGFTHAEAWDCPACPRSV